MKKLAMVLSLTAMVMTFVAVAAFASSHGSSVAAIGQQGTDTSTDTGTNNDPGNPTP